MSHAIGPMTLLIMATVTIDSCLGGDGVAVGQQVTQKRGFVCVDDRFIIGPKDAPANGQPEPAIGQADHSWFLSRIGTIGKVVRVESEYAVVEFPTAAGWEKVGLTDYDLLKGEFYDYWGEPEKFYLRPAVDCSFEPSDCGVLLTGEKADGSPKLPARVRLPKSVLSWPPPRFGEKVTRGPDWNKGSADLEPGLPGTIIRGSPDQVEPRDSDGYVTVEWEATKRRGRYRWDVRRKFDVTPLVLNEVPPVADAAVNPSEQTARDAVSTDEATASPSPPSATAP